MTADPEEIIATLKALPEAARERVLQAFGLEPGQVRDPDPALRAAEKWFLERMASASSDYRSARMRTWFIFMLLRYGGMRLAEILDLTESQMDFDKCQIQLSERDGARRIPISPQVCALLRPAWENLTASFGARPLACDPSLVRRTLASCAKECSLNQGVLNVRSLRRARERELERAGLARSHIDLFLGRSSKTVDAARALGAIRQIVHREGAVRASARNMFYGRIERLDMAGIMVEAELQIGEYMGITALITQASRKSLDLEVGSFAYALIKAPWVYVGPCRSSTPPLPPHMAALVAPVNVYQGIVESTREDRLVRETIIALPQGHSLCALSAADPAPLTRGEKVAAAFSSLAVILTAVGRQR